MDYAKEIAKQARVLESRGYLTGIEGNISIIDRENELIYITPSRRMKSFMRPEQICVVDRNGEKIAGTGRRSSEYFLHEAVYKAKPEAAAVVHSHCPYLTAYALRYEDFVVPETASLHAIFQHFVCLPFGESGTHDIHKGIEDALKESQICLLGGHGVVCYSDSLEDAVGLLCAAEGLAKTMFIARLMK